MNDEKKRAMMAAHLGDIGCAKMRGGDIDGGTLAFHMADAVVRAAHPIAEYRVALAWSMGLLSGDESETIDAAVSAIADGKNPPGSLPAQLLKMRADAVNEGHVKGHGFAAVIALDAVFDLLGVKP